MDLYGSGVIVGPLAPIIGAIVGALIAALVTYFLVVKRKALGFWVSETEDLSHALHRHGRVIVLSVDGRPFLNLNRTTIRARNVGNTSIEGFSFDIVVPERHESYFGEVLKANPDLREAIKISNKPSQMSEALLHVDVASFLNPRDEFEVVLFFDNDAVDCDVRCRVSDVRTRVKRGAPFTLRDFWRADTQIKFAVGIFVAALSIAVSSLGHVVLEALNTFLKH